MVQLGTAERRNHGMLVNLDQRLTDVHAALNVLAKAMEVSTPTDMTLKRGDSEDIDGVFVAEDDAAPDGVLSQGTAESDGEGGEEFE